MATGKTELMADPRFGSIALRAKNQKALAAILQDVFALRTAREWLDEFKRRGVPSGPVNSFADILATPSWLRTGSSRRCRFPSWAPPRPWHSPSASAAIGCARCCLRPAWASIPARSSPNGAVYPAGSAPHRDATPSRRARPFAAGGVASGARRCATRERAVPAACRRVQSSLRTAWASDARCIVFESAGERFLRLRSRRHRSGNRHGGSGTLHRDRESARIRRRAPALTIAVVRGAAFGAGADLVASCDYRLGTPASRFAFPGNRFGVVLGTRQLASVVGLQRPRDPDRR